MTAPKDEDPPDADAMSTRRMRGDVAEALGASGDVLRFLLEALPPPAERFVFDEEIGHGGMGTVEAAHDRTLHRRVAMKVIHRDSQADLQRVQMFLREARVMGRLEHPGTVPVHQIGIDDGGRLFFAMKLVEGATLGHLVRERPPGPLEHGALLNFLDIVVKVCDALAYAHSRGVLHCDIKPSNVMVGDFGEVYLMDWGVARNRCDREWLAERGADAALAADREVDESTRTSIVGTIAYMSPEQARGDNDTLTPRSDVFSVGALLYEVLTQHPPFRGQGVALLMARECAYPSLDTGEGGVPPELARIVARAMAPEPEHRYATAVELRNDLVRFMRGGGQFPRRRYEAGEHIVREGEVGDAAFIISAGRCEVYRLVDGRRDSLRTMRAGEVFGETAVLSPGLRTASVVALDPVTVHVVTREVLEREVDALKPWLGSFIRTLASRFRQREEQARDSWVGSDTAFDAGRATRLAIMALSTWAEPAADDDALLEIPFERFASSLRDDAGATPDHVAALVDALGLEPHRAGAHPVLRLTRARLDELRRSS
ncbi:MAG: protein kinase [Deltaproteobacteria bacterium]|nr:protein kinase [Deltaproteobacteria bacterium]